MTDLNDPLADLFNAAGEASTSCPAPVLPLVEGFVPAAERVFTERCAKCHGTGQFVGYSGRVFGPCFACQGAGSKTFKSSPERCRANRENAARRKAEKTEEALKSFQAEHLEEWQWLKTSTFNFATSLLAALTKFGSLTDAQLAAVRRCIEKDKARAAEAQARKDNAPAVDCSKITEAFERARCDADRDGDAFLTWPKLLLDTFAFIDAPAGRGFEAAILVREGDQKLGRIVGGKFVRSFCCTDDQQARILAAAADPRAAAIAYGLKFKVCGCCGRTLTNKESRERGIGPICAERFFGG